MLNACAIMGSCKERTSLNFKLYQIHWNKIKQETHGQKKYINNFVSYSFFFVFLLLLLFFFWTNAIQTCLLFTVLPNTLPSNYTHIDILYSLTFLSFLIIAVVPQHYDIYKNIQPLLYCIVASEKIPLKI